MAFNNNKINEKYFKKCLYCFSLYYYTHSDTFEVLSHIPVCPIVRRTWGKSTSQVNHFGLQDL